MHAYNAYIPCDITSEIAQVLTIRALYDVFEIVISRIVTFLKSYRNCLVSCDLRFSFEIYIYIYIYHNISHSYIS